MQIPRLRIRASNTDIIEYLLLLLTGFFALSTFSDVVIGTIGYNLIEILFLPILFFYWHKSTFRIPRTFGLSIGEFLLILSVVGSTVLGIINTGAVFAVVTCVRPFVYILLILKYFRLNNREISTTKLYVLSLGCILGDMAYTMNHSLAFESNGYHHINIIAVALITLIPIIRRKGILACFSFILAFSVSILSGYRINTLVTLVALFSGILILLLTVKSARSRLIYLLLILAFLLGLFWCVNHFDAVSAFLTNTLKLSNATVYRSLKRIAGLLNGELTLGDENRIKKLVMPFHEFGSSLFPQGPIGKTDLSRFGYYTDVPIIFLYDLFGSIGAWLFVIVFAARSLMTAFRILRCWAIASDHNKLFVAFLPVLLSLFILNGTFMTFVNISILFALTISGNRLTIPSEPENRERCL